MFEVFEPLIRQYCGQIFALAAVGCLSIMVAAFKVVGSIVSFVF